MEENFQTKMSLLGICNLYKEVMIGAGKNSQGQEFPLTRKDLIGLSDYYVSSLFPLSADQLFVVLLLDKKYLSESEEFNSQGFLITVESEDGKVVGTIKMSGSVSGEGKINPKYMLQAAKLEGVFSRPGEYTLYIADNKNNKQSLGSFVLVYSESLPLTPERVHAIKSDPLAAKYLRFFISCKKCTDEYKVFGGIDKGKNDESKEGFVWYQDVPEYFVCSCGEINQELKYIKNNLHSLLGYKANKFSYEEGIERSYTLGALEDTARQFQELIENDDATEENFQKFIEDNPILLSCFTPKLLKFKAPITAKYKTDFVILNPRNELILIEIEKPSTRLFKNSGDQHSELTHAFGQVENWLAAGKRNRLALIDDINMKGLNIDNITGIRGALVVGRTKPEDALYMEKLRSRPDIDFYTYDDLLKSFVSIIHSYRNL